LPQIGEELARRKWTWEGVDAEVVEEKLEDEEEKGGGGGAGGGGRGDKI
jgi:hypothetical protein